MTCVRGCCPDQLTHYRSIAISAEATPTSKPEAVATISREKRWDKDMPAYSRLRKDGVQPKCIDGAADLESRASEAIEIEMGRTLAR